MRFPSVLAFIVAALFVGSVGAAQATVRIDIDMSTQKMHVESSTGSFDWPVSTARSGYVTPQGSFSPTLLQRMHYSKKYHMSPMPHSIFFSEGYAIHGTGAVGALGRPASHGCVRLSPANAAKLFKMVQTEGASISISGEPPVARHFASRHQHNKHFAGLHSHRGHRLHALAYASTRHHHHRGVKAWQANPSESPF